MNNFEKLIVIVAAVFVAYLFAFAAVYPTCKRVSKSVGKRKSLKKWKDYDDYGWA